MEIFEIEDAKLKITPNCHLIPELKAVISAYEDPIPALAYCHFMTSPSSPYSNLPDAEKQAYISADVGGDFGFEDAEIENAIIKLKLLYDTPIQQLYEGSKNSIQTIGTYLKNLTVSTLTTGRDGNLDSIFRMQKEIGKMAENHMRVEKLWTEQTQQKLRGNAELGEY